MENENVTKVDTKNVVEMSKEAFDTFVKSDVLNWLYGNNLNKITVEDGAGKKAVVKINSKGECLIQITAKEVM
jgi:hypothetical protein